MSIVLPRYEVKCRLDNGVRLVFGGTSELEVTFLGHAVQVKAAPGVIMGNFSPAIVSREWDYVNTIVQEEDEFIRIDAASLELRVSVHRSSGEVTIEHRGAVLVNSFRFYFSEKRPTMLVALRAEEQVKGFAARHGSPNSRGKEYLLWNTNEAAPEGHHGHATYTNLRTGIVVTPGRGGYGILFNNMSRGQLAIGCQPNPDHLVHTADEGEVDVVIFPGPSPYEIWRAHHEVTGPTAMPSPSTLQLQQWRYGWTHAEEPAQLVDRLIQGGFRVGIVGIDLDGFPTPFTPSPSFFSGDRFPNPRALSDWLAAARVKLGMLIDPGIPVGSPVVKEFPEQFWCRDPQSKEVARFPAFSGECYLPDMLRTDVQQLYAERLAPFLQEHGIRKVKIDKAEIGCAPQGVTDDTVWRDSHTMEPNAVEHRLVDGKVISHRTGHDQYAYYMAKAVADASLFAFPLERPIVMVRSGCDGMHRIPGLFRWLGDGWSDPHYARDAHAQMLRFVNSGVFLVCQDTGHFFDTASPQYFRDCFRAAVWEPFVKPHTFKKAPLQAPTEYGPDVERDCRRYLLMRQTLKPYWYSLFWRANVAAEPPMRPCWYDSWNDPRGYDKVDQWKVGPFILVAPLYGDETVAASRRVFFPSCHAWWYCMFTGKTYRGGTEVVVTDYHQDIPVFVCEGAILPKKGLLGTKRRFIDVWPFHEGQGTTSFTWYEDDGYLEPKRATVEITYTETTTKVDGYTLRRKAVQIAARQGDYVPPEGRSITVRFRHAKREPHTVFVDGKEIDFDSRQLEFLIEQDRTLFVHVTDDGQPHEIAVEWR